jgi:hypothetical protein
VILEGDDAGRRDGDASFVYLSKILKSQSPKFSKVKALVYLLHEATVDATCENVHTRSPACEKLGHSPAKSLESASMR